MVICFNHETITAWGCPECRAEEMSRIVDESIQRLTREIDRIVNGRKWRVRTKKAVRP